MMEINITRFFNAAAFRDYSASVAEIGNNAGADTWSAACDDAPDYPELLATDEAREAFRDYVQSWGAWERAEIDARSNAELSALMIQWISGDAREAFPHARTSADISPDDWARYAESDDSAGRLFRGDDGSVYFYVGV
jgi:hypothetical protein